MNVLKTTFFSKLYKNNEAEIGYKSKKKYDLRLGSSKTKN